jgi:hypothetical protein
MDKVINHKIYLYKPDGSPSSFLGELIVDNLKVDIKLQEISSIFFRIPEVINGEVNPRVDEVLDSYIIELWYGKIDGVYENGDFEKIRFRIYSTPLEFAEYKYLHSYSGYSIESDLEFKQIVSWPGIEVRDFFRTIKYNNNDVSPAFTEPGFSYQVFVSTNTSQTKYIKILPSDQPSELDIFIYERRENKAEDSESEASLIELSSGGVNSNDFKAGYYTLTKFNDIVTEIAIALPDNVSLFNGQDLNIRTFSYRLYDNPISRKFAVGVSTNTEEPLSNMYIDLAQDAALGDDTPEYGGYTFNTQSTYSKNGLKLEEILSGIINPEDGLLYNSGFSIGEISSSIASKYRSNLDFNNITLYQAIKDIAESFDSIAVFDTINKTISFYAENEYGINKGFAIKYATYLKSISKEIDASKIFTNARALGKDNIKISLINPTGSEVWEDYSYYLDGFLIDDTDGFTIQQNTEIGLSITYPTTAGLQSRWMDPLEALKIAKWQFTRDYFHNVLSDKNATVYGILHEPFRGLYEERAKLIDLYVKYETQYEKKKANEYKYYYLVEHYKNIYQTKGTNLAEYTYYQQKYNDSKQQSLDFKNTVLAITYNNLYNEEQTGTIAYRFALVRSYLNKQNWEIDEEKLRTFKREATHNDSKLDNEFDLLTATKTFVDENKQPRVTFNISIIDVLEAAEAYQDWDKFKIGDKLYIFFPEFNIDLEAQIREISIDFHGKSLNIVVSTVRNYNRSFGNYLLKAVRRFHNASMNTVMYYKDANEVTIQDTNNFRQTFEEGIDAGNTSISTGAVDDSTGESSTTTDGEGQKSKVVTGVDIYTEALRLSEFTTGVKITDGRVLTFKPYNVSGQQWVQEVEISADNGFAIRKIYATGSTIDVERLAYIDSDDGSAYFAGWRLDPGQFTSGSGSSFVSINSQPILTNPYAFWSGNLLPTSAPFAIKKDGTIIAEKGLIAGLTIAKDSINPNLIKFYAGTGNFYNTNTPFYLDNGGNFSLYNKLKFDISTQVLTVNGTIVATSGSIGGWTINGEQLNSGAANTYVAINASSLSSYAFWAGAENPTQATFSITKSGSMYATSGIISGLNIGKAYKDPDDKINLVNSKDAIFKRIGGGAGVWGEDQTSFYLDEDGRFSLSDELKWDPDLDTFFVNGTFVATQGFIGGFRITDDTIQQGEDTTRFVIKSDPEAPFIGIKQLDLGYNKTGIFLGIEEGLDELNEPIYTPKLSLVGNTSSFTFDGDKVSLLGGSMVVGENAVSSGSIQIDEAGIYGYYNGNLNPTFALSNQTGQLSAVNIYLQAGSKTAEIGNLTSSLAGDFGFEVTNNGGYFLEKDDISFSATTKRISSVTTDLSVYKKGNTIVVANSTSNDDTYTVASDGVTILDISENILGYYVEVEEDLIDEAAGSIINVTRTQPYKVSVTDEGFFILTVNGIDAADTAMSVRYDNNRIWAKRMLISDIESEEGASVVIGTIAANDNLETPETYGIIAKSTKTVEIEGQQVQRINTTYLTSEGFKIVQNGNITFIVNPEGNITAETLYIKGNSRLAGWLVQDDHFRSVNYSFTTGNEFSNNGIRFNNDGSIRGRQFRIDTDGNSFFKGDLTAATGTFGDITKGHVILGQSNPLLIKNNETPLMTLLENGTLKVANYTVSESSLYTNIKSSIDAVSNGVYLGSDGIALGENSPFKVTDQGYLTAVSGQIGGFNIGADTLSGGSIDNYVGISVNNNTVPYAFWAGDDDNTPDENTPFTVTHGGAVKATLGNIAGWSINSSSLFSNNTIIKSGVDALISINQSNPAFESDGIFIGNVYKGLDINGNPSYEPSLSFQKGIVQVNQTFNGSYTNGTTTLSSDIGGSWTTNQAVIVNPSSVNDIPNDAISTIITNLNLSQISLEAPRSLDGSNYLAFISRGLTSGTTRSITYSGSFTEENIMTYRYWLGGNITSSTVVFQILLNGSIVKEYIAGQEEREWQSDSIPILVGTNTIEFRYIKSGATNRTLYLGLENIIIQKVEGVYYTTETGMVVNKGEVAGFQIDDDNLTAQTNASIRFGSTGLNTTGVYIGNLSNNPSFSLRSSENTTYQENFNGTFTQGSTTLNSWTISDTNGVYLDYTTAPNVSIVVDDYNIKNDLSYAMEPFDGSPYFLVKKLVGAGYQPTLSFNIPNITKSYRLTFRAAIARPTSSSSIQILVGTNLDDDILTINNPIGSANGVWFSREVIIPSGSSQIIFSFNSLSSVVVLFAIDNIVITELASGLSYSASGGVLISEPTIDNNDIVYRQANRTMRLRPEALTANRTITFPNQSGSAYVWSLVGGAENQAITQTFVDASTTQSISLISSSNVNGGDLLALEVSASNSTTDLNNRQIVFCRVGSGGATTTGVGMLQWSTLDSSTTGNSRTWSVHIARTALNTLQTRYGGYHLLSSSAAKVFGTFYIFRIWKVGE